MKPYIFLSCLLAITLSACGGGGGDNANAGTCSAFAVTLTQVSPSSSWQSIAAHSTFKVTFSNSIKASSVRVNQGDGSDTIELYTNGDVMDLVLLNVSVSDKQLRIEPQNQLSPDSNYTLQINPEISDICDQNLASVVTRSFRTQSPTLVDLTIDRAHFVDGSGEYEDYAAIRAVCQFNGWTKLNIEAVIGEKLYRRPVLYKGPNAGLWKGAILVLHGGSSNYSEWCAGQAASEWLKFVKESLARNYAVFLLDSTDITTDANGNLCGKVWDDNILARDNLDLPYIDKVIRDLIPSQRPNGSSNNVFMVGFSSGGFMTVRAATHLNQLIKKFAAVANGDPYGWYRDCSYPSARPTVAGEGFDSSTLAPYQAVGSCGSYIYDPDATYSNELPWEDGGASSKPTYLAVQHYYDGITDYSCHNRVRHQLNANGYAGSQYLLVPTGDVRDPLNHTWFPEFTTAILDFFDAP